MDFKAPEQISNYNGDSVEAFTYVIDPNPVGKDFIPQEDLMIYVNFRALPKNRSVIETDGTFNSQLFSEKGIQFIATTRQNGKDWITTNPYNIGNGEGSDECFGIKSINIDYNASYTPMVKFVFEDAMGGALFNGYETVDSAGIKYNTSKYATFFTMPYPLFELTVKGFYGKAVTYCLHLTKWNSKFNAESGSFEIEADFVGYTFAFLADILMKFVQAVTSTEIGGKYLSKENVPPLNEFLTSLGKLTRISEEFKNSNEDYNELKIINSVENTLDRLQKAIGRSAVEFDTSIYGNILPIPQLKPNNDQLFIRDVLILLDTAKDTHDIILQDIQKFVVQHNDFIDKNVGQYPYLSAYKITKSNINISSNAKTINDDFVKDLKSVLAKNDNAGSTNILSASQMQSALNISADSPQKYYIIDYRDFRLEVSKLLNEIGEKKSAQEVEVNKQINEKFKGDLGFDLSIQTVFNIIIGNVQAYLDYIFDVALAAENPSIQSSRRAGLRNTGTDVWENSDRIYPFPATFDSNTGEQVWIGDVVGEDNPAFPEIQFIKEVINAFVSNNTKAANERRQNVVVPNTNNSGGVYGSGGGDWFPINVVDNVSSGYDGIDSYELSQLYRSVAIKALVGLEYPLTTTMSDYMGRIDGAFAASKIENTVKALQIKNIPALDFNQGVADAVKQLSLEKTIPLGGKDFYGKSNSIGFEIAPLTDDGIIKNFPNTVNKTINSFNVDLADIFIPQNNKNIHRKLNRRNYIIQGDLTDSFWDLDVFLDIKQTYKEKTSKELLPSKETDTWVINYCQDLTIFDGRINPNIDNIKNTNNIFTNNARKYLGNAVFGSSIDVGTNLFEQGYYVEANNEWKSILILYTIPIKYYDHFYKCLSMSGEYAITNIQTIWLTSRYYLARKIQSKGYDLDNLTVENMVKFLYSEYLYFDGSYFSTLPKIDENAIRTFAKRLANTIPTNTDLSYLNPVFVDYMAQFFKSWIDGSLQFTDFTKFVDFEKIFSDYTSMSEDGISEDYSNYEDYKSKYDIILKEFQKSVKFIYYQPSKVLSFQGGKKFIPNSSLFVENFLDPNVQSSDVSILTFATGWKSIFDATVSLTPKPSNNNTNTNIGGNVGLLDFDTELDFYLKDKDFKISVYNHFKNLYDKWIGGNLDSNVHNFCSYGKGNLKNGRLIDRFHFIDRTWSYIGDKAVVNPKPLMVLSELSDISLYEFIGRVTGESNFNFHVLPTYVNYKNLEDVMTMFTPQATVENAASGASFIAMYVGGRSKVLDLTQAQNAYVNDGFDFRLFDTANIPQGFKDRRLPINYQDLDDSEKQKYNMVAFRVAYADQNQNIFKDVQLNQTEHKDTGEFYQALSDAFDNRGGTKRIYKSANLYNMFSLRSYKCTVNCLGNMLIHPMTYFQLDNVPFFHGAYLITNVSHMVDPHKVMTTFSGYRMPRFSYPIVDSVTSYVDIPLNETLFSKEQLNTSVISSLNWDEYFAFSSVGEDNETTLGDNRVSNELNPNQAAGSGITSADIQRARSANNKLFEIGMERFHFDYWIQQGNNLSLLQNTLQTIFNPNNPPNFGISKAGNCYGWTKLAMKALGVIQDAGSGVDAWTFMGGWNPTNTFFVPLDKYKQGGWKNQDLKELGIPDGSFVAGFYPTSNHKERSIDVLTSRRLSEFFVNKLRQYLQKETNPIRYTKSSGEKVNLPPMKDYIMTSAALSKINRSWMNKFLDGQRMPFVPPTHSMLYINGQLFHSVGKVHVEPTSSLRILAWYPFLDLLKSKLR